MKILVVTHYGASDLGALGPVLDGMGRIRFLDRPVSGLSFDAKTADLVLCLGSDWSVYDSAVQRDVRQELQLLSISDDMGIPVLGICFGAQMIAHAFGGSVSRSPTPEFGWTVVGDVAHEEIAGCWMQWHSDRIEVPDSFSVIGRNDAGVQAFRYRRFLGVQFHPEATYEVVSQWITSGGHTELKANGVGVEQILDATIRNEVESRVRCRALLEWFLNDVAQSNLGKP